MALDTKTPRIRPLTVFLLKTGTREYEDALEDPARLTRQELRTSLPFKGCLYLAPQRQALPKWLGFLEEGTRSPLERLYNASTSAVLFIRATRRVFAFTFGYGRSLLRPERIERSFGLRVVVNTVERLQSVDSKTVQELTVRTRRQASRTSPLANFGIDKEEDLLDSVAGVPRDQNFARVVVGADALQFRAQIGFDELGAKCGAILWLYRRDDYKRQGFEFIDHVSSVRDPGLIGALDAGIVADLAARKCDGMHMAPPDIIDMLRTDGFSFVKNTDPDVDLSFESFFEQIRKPEDLSIDRLKRQKVFLHPTEAAEAVPRWPVYQVLVAERSEQGRRYVLSGGEWYEIETSFAESIAERVAKIRNARIRLPSARVGEKEADYNRRAGRLPGIYCVDQKCPRVDGDPVELCDLYTRKRQFIHVKRWKASSTLSHLFAQGRIAAEAFVSDEAFRNGARELLGQKASSLASQVPVRRPDPGRYQVVFAIIKDAGTGWKRGLPFFSQLHLVRSAEALRRQGFGVRLAQIGLEE